MRLRDLFGLLLTFSISTSDAGVNVTILDTITLPYDVYGSDIAIYGERIALHNTSADEVQVFRIDTEGQLILEHQIQGPGIYGLTFCNGFLVVATLNDMPFLKTFDLESGLEIDQIEGVFQDLPLIVYENYLYLLAWNGLARCQIHDDGSFGAIIQSDIGAPVGSLYSATIGMDCLIVSRFNAPPMVIDIRDFNNMSYIEQDFLFDDVLDVDCASNAFIVDGNNGWTGRVRVFRFEDNEFSEISNTLNGGYGDARSDNVVYINHLRMHWLDTSRLKFFELTEGDSLIQQVQLDLNILNSYGLKDGLLAAIDYHGRLSVYSVLSNPRIHIDIRSDLCASINWEAVSGARHYHVYERLSVDSEPRLIAETTATEFVVPHATGFRLYHVTAIR
jgi:hypothetical protein